MIASVANVNSFKSLFSKTDIMGEIVFKCDEDGMRFRALDKSSTIFMSVELSTDFFIEYKCEEPESFAVSIAEINKCLKPVKNDLIIDTTSEAVFLMSGSKVFKLWQLEMDYQQDKELSNIPYEYSIILPSDWLKETVKDIKNFSKDLYITTDADKIELKGIGVSGEYTNNYGALKELEETKIKLSVEKLEICLGTNKVSNEIKLKGADSKPLSLNIEGDGITVNYLIAPIIEMDD